jgi:predicted acyl esterase
MQEPLEPGTVYEFAIEVWPTSNLFRAGHRLRLEIANSDSIIASSGRPHLTLRNVATNTIHEGGQRPSRLVVPFVPR